MRIIQISSTVPPSPDGVADAVIRLLKMAMERKISSIVITSCQEQVQDGVYCIVPKWTLFSFPYRFLLDIKDKNDIILLHYPTARYGRKLTFTFFTYVLRFMGFRVVFYLHEYTTYSILGRIRTIIMLLPVDKILASDSQNYNAIRKKKLFDSRVILYSGIPSIIPEKDYINKSNKVDNEATKIRVLYFGFLREGKGIVPFIELFEKDDILNNLFILEIIGGLRYNDKKKELYVKKLLQESDKILYRGFLTNENICELYSQSEVVLLPYEDGVSERRSSFLSAMSFGKLVITTKPKFPMLGLQHKRNVWFLDKCSPEHIRDSLLEIIKISDAERKNICVEAKRWFNEYYSDDVLFNKLIKTVLEIPKD